MPEAPLEAPQPLDRGADSTESSGSVLSFLKAHESRHGSTPATSFYLSGIDEHDRVELSEELFAVLKQAATELSRGRSVSIHARDQEISTQQAADLLGLSRPTVVKLIDDGELPAHVPGTVRRRLRLADVIDYRDALHRRRSEFISRSSEEYDVDDEVDVAAIVHRATRTS